MEMDSFDLDALVNETFKASLEMKGMNPFDSDFSFESENDALQILPEHVPGILYNLEKKASTFVIRILPSKNLADDYQKVLASPEEYPTLRLLNDDERDLKEKLAFFESDSFVLAQELKQQLGNKRFPIFEEHVLNVSDPGDSWWITTEGSQLKVFFKLSRTESMDKLIKLGPLGDTDHAIEMFSKLYGYFQMLFPVADYSSGHGQLTIRCERAHDPIFKAFIKIFETGDADHEFWDYLRDLEIKAQGKPYMESLQKANFFMMQIATMRRFWKKVQTALDA
jgi:hypothetical protein